MEDFRFRLYRVYKITHKYIFNSTESSLALEKIYRSISLQDFSKIKSKKKNNLDQTLPYGDVEMLSGSQSDKQRNSETLPSNHRNTAMELNSSSLYGIYTMENMLRRTY